MICAKSFAMADEAFALSPISARAMTPSEEDYDAIREAFMETSRGRWFLGEYAKRNRNADTRMVLDAVARIEETIAAQNNPPADPGLAEALVGIRAALDEARAAATAVLGDLAPEESLAAVRKGARVIREIAWRLREIGADGRICDLIDSQLGAIDGACDKIAAIDPATALSAAFELVERRIAEFDDSDAPTAAVQARRETVASSAADFEDASPSPAEPITSPAATASDTASAAVGEKMTAGISAASEAEVAIGNPQVPGESVAGVAAETAPEASDTPTDAFDAHDEAVLDMIALEMAAPDSAGFDDPPEDELDEIEAGATPRAEPLGIAERPDPTARAVQPSPEVISTSPETSLGSSLITNGIVPRPKASRPDPLAPIRRMSQAEKIAFFS